MDRTLEELEHNACKYWPRALAESVANINPLPLLIDTQEIFLGILKCSDTSPVAWQNTLKSSSLSANLFLKHLVVISDIGGERLQRFARDFDSIFPSKMIKILYMPKPYTYKFSSTSPKNWSNASLKIDKSSLTKPFELTEEMADVATLLMWGSMIENNEKLPVEIMEKCCIGSFIGNPNALDLFVKQRYLYVSRITGGSTANDSGHFCEQLAVEKLRKMIKNGLTIDGHTIPGVSQNDRNLTTFDIVVKNNKSEKCCAIEVSFQVTTNSVIERKSLLARERKELLNALGHKVAYIIDGSGNFQRRNAVTSIIEHSDCVVNFSDAGIKELADYINKAL